MKTYFSPTRKRFSTILVLVVPYRNRPKNLEQFLSYTAPLLQSLGAVLIVAEQSGGQRFNKGRTVNAAVRYLTECGVGQDKVALIVNDIDKVPRNLSSNRQRYNAPCNGKILHLLGAKGWLGGVFKLNLATYRQINGFHNGFWGWGSEDVELLRQAQRHHIPIDNALLVGSHNTRFFHQTHQKRQASRPALQGGQQRGHQGRYQGGAVAYARDLSNKEKNKRLAASSSIHRDGLAELRCELLSKQQLSVKPLIWHLVVDIGTEE